MSGRVIRLYGIPLSHPVLGVRGMLVFKCLLDEVDRLIAQGVIGGDQLNAADFQIAPSVRVLLAMTDIACLVADRPAASLARRVVAKYPVIPAALPADWIPTSPSAARANS